MKFMPVHMCFLCGDVGVDVVSFNGLSFLKKLFAETQIKLKCFILSCASQEAVVRGRGDVFCYHLYASTTIVPF